MVLEMRSPLEDKVIASIFLEPSTRTRLSFESAAMRCGANVITVSDAQQTSLKKQESLEDTIRMIAGYSDGIVMRNPESGSAKIAASVSDVPIINAGDGGNEHPTQTLMDLFTIQQTQGRLDNLVIGIGFDLKHSRTIHSLIKALRNRGVEFVIFSPKETALPDEYIKLIENSKSTYRISKNFRKEIPKLDILYLNRFQEERFAKKSTFEKIRWEYRVNLEDLAKAKSNFKILNPLPRVDELNTDVDDHPAAYYFQQARNGLYVRQAILEMLVT